MFRNRYDAGRQLAQKLMHYQTDKPIILALPRGGVPVGYQVAQNLNAPLDVFVVRKIGAPWNPEFGVGAIAPGVQILDEATLEMLALRASDLKEVIDQEQQELKRRLYLYRQEEDFLNVAGKTVILIDDGLATGVSMRAAIQGIKLLNPARVILAVPVGPLDTINVLKKLVEELICLEIPTDFFSVSSFYLSFPQISDEEVIRLLKQARQERK